MTGNTHQGSPYDLENLSIPELEALLQQDFMASDSGVPDTDYIMAIMEVIQRKEESQPDYQKMNIDQAWEEFQNFYNSNEGKKYSLYRSEESDREDPINQALPKRKKFRSLYLVALLALLLVAVTCVPVVGHVNVIQMVMSKAYSTFHLTPKTPDSTSESVDSLAGSYDTIQDALEACNITTPVVPKILLEEFEQSQIEIINYPLSHNTKISSHFVNATQDILLQFTIHDRVINGWYERNVNELFEVYTANMIEHSIFKNMDDIAIIWNNGNLECSITGNIQSVSEAKELIDSIYKRSDG